MCGFMLGVFTLFGSWYFEALFALIVVHAAGAGCPARKTRNAAASFSRLFGPRRRAGAAPYFRVAPAGRDDQAAAP